MQYIYIFAPIFGYVTAGIVKFFIHCIQNRKLAFDQIGLGGFPSTHTCTVVTTATVIGLKNGFDSPYFGIMITLLIIVIIDALDIRRRVGQQVTVLKELFPKEESLAKLRERTGHTFPEVIGGIFVGILCGYLLFFLNM